MLHWDGFLTAKTSLKSCWAVDLVVLNAGKVEPIGPIPILFIPSSSEKLIKDADSNLLMFFLEPLIKDLEEIFVKGFPVSYAYPVDAISDKLPLISIGEVITLRAMLLLWTGDHPAQCKIGGLKVGGYSCCRRHKVASRWRGIPNTKKGLVEYHDNRKQHRYPPIVRTMEDTAVALANWRQLPEGKEKDLLGREAGISSHSILWRLHALYGFDILRDIVYDVMHILALCIFKKYVHMLVQYGEQHGRAKDIDAALYAVKHCRPQGLGARWPRNISSLGYYKAEEYQLFVMWCLPHILDHLNIGESSVLGATGILLTEIGRLFYSHSRKYGWTEKAMVNARKLLAAWYIRMEESAGPNSSPLEHVAGILQNFTSMS